MRAAPRLYAAFQLQPQGWRGRVVASVTGRPVHVELVVAPVDGVPRALRLAHGVRAAWVSAEGQDDTAGWRWLDLAPLALDAAQVIAAADRYVGTDYDTLRAVAGWWLGLDRVGRAICSEAFAVAVVAGGADSVLLGRPSTTPRRLLLVLEQLLAAHADADLAAREEAAFRSLGDVSLGVTP